MQRLYDIAFVVGVALVAGFAATSALSLLSLVQVATKAILFSLAGALAILVPINILVWHFNRRRAQSALEFPMWPRMFDLMFGALMGFVVSWLLYGWIAGRALHSDAVAHQRWEASFFAIWSATREQRHVFRRR